MLTMHHVAGKEKSRVLCQAFVDGAPRDAEGAVFYGVTETNIAAWTAAKRSGRPWYYLDNSYLDATRGVRFRATKNALQVPAAKLHEAALREHRQASDGKRFDALGLTIKPWWPQPGGYALLVAQSPWFMKLVGAPHWLESKADHWQRTKWRAWNRNKAAQMATLDSDLAGAHCLVTHTSAAAVQATLAGVPVYVAREHALTDMICSVIDETDERRAFLSILADHEFSLDEMRKGMAWATLQR